MCYTEPMMMRLAVKMAALMSFAVVFTLALPLFQQTPTHSPPVQDVATCNAACHAAGLKMMDRQITASVKTLTAHRTCWVKTPANTIPRTLIVRGAYIGTMNVHTVSFMTAWNANHDKGTSNDVLVLAACK